MLLKKLIFTSFVTLTLSTDCKGAPPPPLTPSFCTSMFCAAVEDQFNIKGVLSSRRTIEEDENIIRAMTLYSNGVTMTIEALSPRNSKDELSILASKMTNQRFGNIIEERQFFKFCGFDNEYEGQFCVDFLITTRGLSQVLEHHTCPISTIWILNPYAASGNLTEARKLKFNLTKTNHQCLLINSEEL